MSVTLKCSVLMSMGRLGSREDRGRKGGGMGEGGGREGGRGRERPERGEEGERGGQGGGREGGERRTGGKEEGTGGKNCTEQK